jgi:hypothetical protein
MNELELLAHADALGRYYTETHDDRRVLPSDEAPCRIGCL